MLSFAIVLALAACAAAVPTGSRAPVYRTYLPQEEDPLRVPYILWLNEDGTLRNESLTEPYTEVRAKPSDVTFHLYTRSNRDDGFVVPGSEFGRVALSPFDPGKKTLFISHGWMNDYKSDVNRYIRPAALEAADVNVFVVDWSPLAKMLYLSARSAVPSAGKVQGEFINYLMDSYGIGPQQFTLVGHSLGAHLAGCAGAAVNGLVSSIVGLDPAGPFYSLSDLDVRIDETDAESVHIVHTSAFFLGIGSSIGHADFFPNGGSGQPGCGLDLVGSCSHSRAYQYYAESLVSSGFISTYCDSYTAFSRGRCEDNIRTYLGEIHVDTEAEGDFYLDTASSKPFALGTP